MPKPFLTYEEQVEKLIAKGLTIDDVDSAIGALRNIGYFSLVNGYKKLLQDSDTRTYRGGATFSDLVGLYQFDDWLREIFIHYLMVVERKLRSTASYSFCCKYGEAQEKYLDSANYGHSGRQVRTLSGLLRILDGIANRGTDYPYIVHQRLRHGNVPLWAAVNAMTFGQVSRLYCCFDSSVRAAVAKQYDNVNERQLEQMIAICVLYRNACAHGERLFDHRVRVDMPDMPLHGELGLTMRGDQYQMGKHDLFAVVIALRHLLPQEEFLAFMDELEPLLLGFHGLCHSVPERELLSLMGFPCNWREVRTAPLR